jgi:hypothetical protein
MERLSTLVRKTVLPVLMMGSILVFLTFAGSAATGYGGNVGVRANYNSGDFGFLAQYGQWDDYGSYGRVWRPWVDADWRPFMNGDWEWDGSDWCWVSYEPFGDIVFHYGYWDYDPIYGWFWIPGNDVWSPAPVEWFWYGDFACWAPLRFGHNHWGEPWEEHSRGAWNVVRDEDFTRENVGRYHVDADEMHNGGHETSFRHQPNVKFVQQMTHQHVAAVNINVEKANGASKGQFRKTMLPPETLDRVRRNRPAVEQAERHHGSLAPLPSGGTQQHKGNGNGWNSMRQSPGVSHGNGGGRPSGGYHGNGGGQPSEGHHGDGGRRQQSVSHWNGAGQPMGGYRDNGGNDRPQHSAGQWGGGSGYGRPAGGGAHWGGNGMGSHPSGGGGHRSGSGGSRGGPRS